MLKFEGIPPVMHPDMSHRSYRSPLGSPGSGERYVDHPLGHTSELWHLVGSCGAAVVFACFFRIFSAFSRVTARCAFVFSFSSFCSCLFRLYSIIV